MVPKSKRNGSSNVKPGSKLPYTNKPLKNAQSESTKKAKAKTKEPSGKPMASRNIEISRVKILGEKFLELHKKASTKVARIEQFRVRLQAQLNDIERLMGKKMDPSQKKQMATTINNLCAAQRDLRTVLVNNLRAGYKAIAIIEANQKTPTALFDQIELSLNRIHDITNEMVMKPVQDFKVADLNYLKKTIHTFETQINSSEFKTLISELKMEESTSNAFKKTNCFLQRNDQSI